MRRIVLAALVALAAGACSREDATAISIDMKLIALRPEKLTVTAGTTVNWHQRDAGVHTVTSGLVEDGAAGVTTRPDGRFDSEAIETGKTFSFTFADAGTYPYFCAIHPATMRGVVTVE
jgi:plastocyanin